MNILTNTMEFVVAAIVTATSVPLPNHGGLEQVWRLVEASAAEGDLDRTRELLREAEAVARSSVEGHESDVTRRYALAVVLGLRANVEGSRERVRVAAGLLPELDAILALDPAHAGARHILGRLHAGVRRMNRVTRWVATNLLGGDELKKATWEAAEEHLAFAERSAPEVADHHLQLALLYRDTDRPALALSELGHVMELQATTALELAVQAEAMEVWTELDETSGVAATK